MEARAQGGLLFQGIADLELWKTDSASNLLARNAGSAGPLLRLDVWAAIEPLANLVFFGELSGETGKGRNVTGNELYAKQFGARYSFSDAFNVEGGRIRQIVGTFSSRQLSFRNPLIGTPDGYATTYPYGARVDGSAGMVDYRAGILTLPLFRSGYVPEPGATLRPAIGVGITPRTGLRFGASATMGPYLNKTFTGPQLRTQDWKSFKQRIVAGDAQFSYGYFEAHGEMAYGTYEVPGRATAIDGLLFYLEPKYTFTPRFFMALRFERNDYPFIRPVNSTSINWIANSITFNDTEIGAGYRPTASTLLKLTVRADHWTPNANPNAPHDNGYAVAFQLSQFLDFVELATRKR